MSNSPLIEITRFTNPESFQPFIEVSMKLPLEYVVDTGTLHGRDAVVSYIGNLVVEEMERLRNGN